MFNDLIRKQDVTDLLKKWIAEDEADARETGYVNEGYDMALLDVLDAVENIIEVRNAVELSKVKQKTGEWAGTVCTACGGSTSFYYDCIYCPNCGAEMKGEAE